MQASHRELQEARRLLESSSRAGLTTEARVVLEAQLVNAKRAADEKSRLAAALGDQVSPSSLRSGQVTAIRFRGKPSVVSLLCKIPCRCIMRTLLTVL